MVQLFKIVYNLIGYFFTQIKGRDKMLKKRTNLSMLANANRLPVLDWNICFFGAHTQTVEPPWFAPTESHLAFEVITIIKGSESLVIQNKNYIIRKGDVLIIPPGFIHLINCGSQNKTTYFCAHFDIDDSFFITEMVQKCKLVFKNGTDNNLKLRCILDKWINMIAIKPDSSFQSKMRSQIILSELLISLDEIIHSGHVKSFHSSPTESKYAREIGESIKSEFKFKVLQQEQLQDDDICIRKIMESLCISSGYGFEVFKKVYGLSPRKYLTQIKLNETKHLLTFPELSITEISRRVGYKNVSHFSRQFKRWTNKTPLEYRADKVAEI